MSATVTGIAISAKVLTPLINDIYKGTKGKIKSELDKWSSARSIRKITKNLSRIEQVKTIWTGEDDVSLHTFYHPSKIIIKKQSTPVTATSIDDLPPGNLTIQGIVGQGKSILLRYLASQSIRSENSPRIPIFIELRTLTLKLGLIDAIKKILESIDATASDETLSYLFQTGKLALLLDGFDELSENLIQDTINEIDHLSVRYPDLKIIITSRPGNEIQKVSGFKILDIAQLKQQDYPSFLTKLGITGEKRTNIIEAIKNSPSKVSGIIVTPLMLTLVVLVYRAEREIPSTLPDFFERIFQVVFTRHDKLKPGFIRAHKSGLSERKLQILFEAFCFMAMQNGYGRTLRGNEFNNAFDSASEYIQEIKCEVDKFKYDITKIACLMLEEGIDLTTFIHKSILEYYAASFIKNSSDEIARIFYSKANNNYRQWFETLNFLQDIDPFRHTEYFALPVIENLITEVIGIIERKKTKELIDFISGAQPILGVEIINTSINEGSVAEVGAIGPYYENNKYGLEKFGDIIVESLSKALEPPLTGKACDIINARLTFEESRIIKRDDSSVVNLKTLMEALDPEPFRNGMTSMLKLLQDKKISLKTIILTQEKRITIFGGKNITIEAE